MAEKNGNIYLVFHFTDKNKEVLKEYTEFWDGVKNLIRRVNDKPGEYGKDFVKIRFESDDNLPLNKTLKLHNLTIIFRSVFEKNDKYCPQVFFRGMCVRVIKMLQYEKIYAAEGVDINISNISKECMLCNYWYFKDIGYTFQPYACNRCHNLSMMVYDLDDFMILNIKGVDYRCFVCNVSKNTAIKLLNNSQLDDKGTLSIWILVQIKHLLK